jgi:hypothetical protein
MGAEERLDALTQRGIALGGLVEIAGSLLERQFQRRLEEVLLALM